MRGSYDQRPAFRLCVRRLGLLDDSRLRSVAFKCVIGNLD